MRGHIQLRRGLLTHLKHGEMTLEELSVYVYLHYIADWRTGKCYTSAPHIHYDTFQTVTIRKIQRILESLEKKRYINRFIVDGKRGDYHILIHKYVPTDGAWTGKYLNAWKSESSAALVFEDRVEDDVDSDVDDDARSDVRRDVRTGEFVKKLEKNSERKSKEVREELKKEVVNQPDSTAPSARPVVENPLYTEDERDAAIHIGVHFCKLNNIEWIPAYTTDLLPVAKKFGDTLVKLVHSTTIRSKFWMKDLSSVRQLIWRLNSEGEDGLLAQFRQEQNLDRELLRADIKKKLKKNGDDLDKLTPEEWEFTLRDAYAAFNWRESTLFPPEGIFMPLVEQWFCASNIQEILGWVWQNHNEWIDDLNTPEKLVENWESTVSAFRIEMGYEQGEDVPKIIREVVVDEL